MNGGSQALKMAMFVSLGGFVFGFDASVISGVIGFVVAEFQLTDWQQGFVVSSPTLGAVIAALAAGPLSDQIGRKKVLQFIAFLYLISATASAMAVNFETLVIARFVGGLAFSSLMIAPIYIAEISPSGLRGKMVSINQLNIVLGLSAAYFANYLILKSGGSGSALAQTLGLDQHTWRWMLGAETLPALIWFLLLMRVPESPRWLVMKGATDKARHILTGLMGRDGVDARIQEIEATGKQKQEPFKIRLAMLLSPKMRFVLMIGLIVGIAQQITGVNAIYFYAPSIFEQSGVGKDAAFAQAIWVGVLNVVFTLAAMALIDKLGRKPLLIAGLTGVFLSMVLCAYGFHQATWKLTPETTQSLEETVKVDQLQPLMNREFGTDIAFKQALAEVLGADQAKAHEADLIKAAVRMNPYIILIGILGFVASFAVSLGPVMWVLFSEIFPNRIRGLAISFVGSINSCVSFLVQLVFPWELSNLGTGVTFLIYGVFALLGLVLVAWLLPETKGRTLEELELDLTRPSTAKSS